MWRLWHCRRSPCLVSHRGTYLEREETEGQQTTRSPPAIVLISYVFPYSYFSGQESLSTRTLPAFAYPASYALHSIYGRLCYLREM